MQFGWIDYEWLPYEGGLPYEGEVRKFLFSGGVPARGGGGGIFKREVHTPLHTTGIVGA